jgi:hypothetical protein
MKRREKMGMAILVIGLLIMGLFCIFLGRELDKKFEEKEEKRTQFCVISKKR